MLIFLVICIELFKQSYANTVLLHSLSFSRCIQCLPSPPRSKAEEGCRTGPRGTAVGIATTARARRRTVGGVEFWTIRRRRPPSTKAWRHPRPFGNSSARRWGSNRQPLVQRWKGTGATPGTKPCLACFVGFFSVSEAGAATVACSYIFSQSPKLLLLLLHIAGAKISDTNSDYGKETAPSFAQSCNRSKCSWRDKT